MKLHTRYQAVDVKSNYIQSIAKIFGKEFQDIVINTDEILDEHIVLLRKTIEGKIDEIEGHQQWHLLVESAINVTKEAAEIKIKGVS